jgi:hypothetical protein
MSAADFHMATSGTWSIGTLIWVPIATLLILGLVAFAVFMFMESELGMGLGFIAAALAIIIGSALPSIGMYPYKGEYHQWRDVSGTVEKIDKRLIAHDKSMEDKFVVRFANSGGRQFGCDDTRCASVDPGDWLKLSCKRVWQYTGTDGYDCRFSATRAAS